MKNKFLICTVIGIRGLSLILGIFGANGFANAPANLTRLLPPLPSAPLELASDEKLITILGTNDLHGALEPHVLRDGQPLGGMAILAGTFSAIKSGIQKQYGEGRAGALLLDAGDQFQGTLLSNYNEGKLIFGAMNEMGYDAAIPGNHDYDFGPLGWTVDQDPNGRVDRSSLLQLAAGARFPLLSANTYYRASLTSVTGMRIPPQKVNPVGCQVPAGEMVNWGQAIKPEFLRPFLIKVVAGVRVAVIGVDHVTTSTVTTAANVSDLCFRDEAEAYYETRLKLQGQADVFVMLVHNGNTDSDYQASLIAAKLLSASSRQIPNPVDVIIAGHTHFVNNQAVGLIPILQAGANAKAYSRVDLVWSATRRALNPQKMRARGGIPAAWAVCPSGIPYCRPGQGGISLEGVPVVPNPLILAEIQKEKMRVLPIAMHPVTMNPGAPATAARIDESPLANLISDAVKEIAQTQIAVINAGGLRTALPSGPVVYGQLFQILPFNNQLVRMAPMPLLRIVELLTLSAQTCGEYDALMQSGLKVQFARNCAALKSPAVDKSARLIEATLLSTGETLVKDGAIVGDPNRLYTVATLDFLASGGSGYAPFVGVATQQKLGIMRDLIARLWQQRYPQVTAAIDGRWSNLNRR